MFDHPGGDVFETDRHFDTFFAEFGRHAVQQVRGGQVAYHTAALAAHFVHIPVNQQQDVIGGDVIAQFIHDGDTVGVAVGGQAQIVFAILDGADQLLQGFEVRGWGAPAEERVVAFVDERDTAARLGQDDIQGELAHTVHRGDDDFQVGFAGHVQAD